MKKITDEMLATLIEGLKEYKAKGVVDPWLLDSGETIEPLDALLELQELRSDVAKLEEDLYNEEETHTQEVSDLQQQLSDAYDTLKEIRGLTH